MKTFALLLLLPSLAFASPWSDELKIKLDQKMATHFRNQSQVGVVVGVIKGNETHVWSYGERVLGGGEAPTGDTIFEMGSITKTFTATLLASEVLKGNLTLDQKVKTLWDALDGTDAGEVTLEQLATHTSGLPRMPDNFAPADQDNPYADYGEDRLLAFLKSFKQEKPGPYPHSYSNLGLGLLGHLITEKLHKETFASFLERILLAPLGMTSTKTVVAPEDRFRAAQGYDMFFRPIPFWDLNVLSPAGVLKTTVNDMLKYARFQMIHGKDNLGAAADLTHIDRHDSEDGGRIGLVWELAKIGKYNVITHGGATGGYRANLVFDKEQQLAAVVLSNTEISPRCILAPVFEADDCAVAEYTKVEPSRQTSFLGTFHAESIGMDAEISLESGMLALQIKGQIKLRLFAKSETEYEVAFAPAVVRFVKNAEGNVNSFVLLQGGKEFEFTRN